MLTAGTRLGEDMTTFTDPAGALVVLDDEGCTVSVAVAVTR